MSHSVAFVGIVAALILRNINSASVVSGPMTFDSFNENHLPKLPECVGLKMRRIKDSFNENHLPKSPECVGLKILKPFLIN